MIVIMNFYVKELQVTTKEIFNQKEKKNEKV